MLFTVTAWKDVGGNRILRNVWNIQAPNANEAVMRGIPFEDTLDGEFTVFKYHGEYRSSRLLVRAVAD